MVDLLRRVQRSSGARAARSWRCCASTRSICRASWSGGMTRPVIPLSSVALMLTEGAQRTRQPSSLTVFGYSRGGSCPSMPQRSGRPRAGRTLAGGDSIACQFYRSRTHPAPPANRYHRIDDAYGTKCHGSAHLPHMLGAGALSAILKVTSARPRADLQRLAARDLIQPAFSPRHPLVVGATGGRASTSPA